MKWTPPKPFNYREWHPWFAWYPTTLDDGRWVWMETVERKLDGLSIDYVECWSYRARDTETAKR